MYQFLSYQDFSFLRDKSSSLLAQIMIILERVFAKVKLNWRLFQVFPEPMQQLQKWVWHRHGKGGYHWMLRSTYPLTRQAKKAQKNSVLLMLILSIYLPCVRKHKILFCPLYYYTLLSCANSSLILMEFKCCILRKAFFKYNN